MLYLSGASQLHVRREEGLDALMAEEPEPKRLKKDFVLARKTPRGVLKSYVYKAGREESIDISSFFSNVFDVLTVLLLSELEQRQLKFSFSLQV